MGPSQHGGFVLAADFKGKLLPGWYRNDAEFVHRLGSPRPEQRMTVRSDAFPLLARGLSKIRLRRGPRSGADVGGQVLAGEGGPGGHEVGRCALEDDPAPVVACARAQVDDPVRVRHHRLVVLDDDHRLARVDQPV